MPRGACPSLRSFSAWAQCAEVGRWRKKAAGEGEAVQEGRLLGQHRLALLFDLLRCQTLPSKRTWSGKGCVETSPNSGWNLQKLEEVGMSKVQTLPQPWPLPCWPSPCPVYLPTWPQFRLASAEVRATTSFPARPQQLRSGLSQSSIFSRL